MELTGNETLQKIFNHFPYLINEFSKYGLDHFFEDSYIQTKGHFTKLKSLLQTANLDENLIIDSLNKIIQERNTPVSDVLSSDLLAMLPCGLRNPFKNHLEKHVQKFSSQYKGFHYTTEGNVNHELSFYPKVDHFKSIDELPDLILSSDVNNFFHKPFKDQFIETDQFQAYEPYTVNNYFKHTDFCDPNHHYTMYTTNLLVMAVDITRLGKRKMPELWSDLLSPEFEQDIIMRGEDDFFCNAVLLPFYKDHGMEAIQILAKNIRTGKHPAEMVKLAEKPKDEESAAIYVLPYFFADKIKSKNIQVVWPKDGAIASPVFFLIKKEAIQKHQHFLDFLFSAETAQLLQERLFPPLHPEVNISFPKPIKWLGWDFLNKNDIGKVKDNIQKTFMKHRETINLVKPE